ncbi:winged helix-turn-helix domain-containing protein [Methanosarcina sp.]|uniref:helix-turn-helix transcriptional regulator n=1 Tax=Methanosarcina sp. TaxID=2213 RepID=UPI0029897790|nr:winged helix-turn-helix domain-containing protein [Methanosarcina sp.]MDW5550571.1 winged helix-turn-helix domain-containing protein [Methanosarcina sp.]MDW5554275.1 winged helix-turn-helix domain-containing protein [Methanosarcina sp.]MDW5559635.1 winged helix-turn-helix domain-containing protein [Methanosarcina sp.]
MKSKAHTRVETRSSLLDTLFLSEKRTNLLLLLKEEGPKNSEDIKDVLDFPWKSITPQIKKLTDWGLVLEDHGVYSLSEMGAVIASNAEFFLSTLSVYEDNLDFWSDHDVSPIPFHILNKIGELGYVRVIEPDFSNVFRIPEEVMTNLMSSKRIMSFISIFHPFSLLLLFEYLQKDIEATTIVTEKVLEAFQTEYHSDIPILKTNNPIINKALIEYKKEIKNVFCSKASNLLVYEGDLKPISMIITDKIFILSLLDKKGRLTTRFLIAFEPQALKWGEELFMYYKERSKSVPSSLSIL